MRAAQGVYPTQSVELQATHPTGTVLMLLTGENDSSSRIITSSMELNTAEARKLANALHHYADIAENQR